MFQKGDRVKWINDKMSCVYLHGVVKKVNKESCHIEYIADWKPVVKTVKNEDIRRDK